LHVVQLPATQPPTHVWFATQCPAELQLCVMGLPVASVAHWFEPGTHSPPHAPAPEQTNWQADPESTQAPALLHTCGWLPRHCWLIGVHATQ
jgi:hypothetical protein